jgi:hypothetical protein
MVMRTFFDVSAVERDAQRRTRRVAIFFEALFAVAVVGSLALDRLAPPPHIECQFHHAQTQSHYRHPYGEPPPVEWTTCAWR